MESEFRLEITYSYKSTWFIIFKSANCVCVCVCVSGKRKGETVTSLAKKQKTDVSTEHPPFYYNIHRHSIKGMNMPK